MQSTSSDELIHVVTGMVALQYEAQHYKMKDSLLGQVISQARERKERDAVRALDKASPPIAKWRMRVYIPLIVPYARILPRLGQGHLFGLVGDITPSTPMMQPAPQKRAHVAGGNKQARQGAGGSWPLRWPYGHARAQWGCNTVVLCGTQVLACHQRHFPINSWAILHYGVIRISDFEVIVVQATATQRFMDR